MDLRQYDTTNIEPMEDFSPLPVGEYTVIIIDSGEKPTKAGDGSYLELTLEVVDGEYHGRKLWDRLNLNNRSEKAKQIAMRTLSAIQRAVGVPSPQDSAELHGLPMIAVVAQEEYDGRTKNVVKAYKPKAVAAKPVAMAPKANSLPWGK